MSTQTYTPNQQTPYQQGRGPSRFRTLPGRAMTLSHPWVLAGGAQPREEG